MNVKIRLVGKRYVSQSYGCFTRADFIDLVEETLESVFDNNTRPVYVYNNKTWPEPKIPLQLADIDALQKALVLCLNDCRKAVRKDREKIRRKIKRRRKG